MYGYTTPSNISNNKGEEEGQSLSTINYCKMTTFQIQRNILGEAVSAHPLAIGRLSEQALREMVTDGCFSTSTKGTFKQFARAYVDAWTHTNRSGQVRVNPNRPQVTITTVQMPPGLDAFMRVFPDTVYRERYTCTCPPLSFHTDDEYDI